MKNNLLKLFCVTVDYGDREDSEFVEALDLVHAVQIVCSVRRLDLDLIVQAEQVALEVLREPKGTSTPLKWLEGRDA